MIAVVVCSLVISCTTLICVLLHSELQCEAKRRLLYDIYYAAPVPEMSACSAAPSISQWIPYSSTQHGA